MTDQQSNGTVPAEATRTEPVFTPPTDIVEDPKGVRLLLDMPGADPDSLDVTLDQRVLRISARSVSSAPEGYALVHAEYRDGNYERSFTVSPADYAGLIAATGSNATQCGSFAFPPVAPITPFGISKQPRL